MTNERARGWIEVAELLVAGRAAVVAEDGDPRGQGVVVNEQQATLAGRQRLGAVEAERRGGAERSRVSEDRSADRTSPDTQASSAVELATNTVYRLSAWESK